MRGFFPAELKFSGYDLIVIKEKSNFCLPLCKEFMKRTQEASMGPLQSKRM